MRRIAVLVVVALVALVAWRFGFQKSPDALESTPAPRVVEPARAAAAHAAPLAAVDEPDSARAASVETQQPAPVASDALPAAAPLRVRIVDDEHGLPVPRLRASVHRGEQNLGELETDLDGFARLAEPVAAGAFELRLVGEDDARDLLQRKRQDALAFVARGNGQHVADPAAPPCEVRVPVGPSYVLDVVAPPAIALDTLAFALKSADPRLAWDVLHDDLRTGGLPWVRFSPKSRFLTGGPPWVLEAKSADGLWLGRAQLDDLESSAIPLRIVLEARAALRGVVLDPDGKPVANEFVLAEAPEGGFDTLNNRTAAGPTNAEGRFALDALPPGPRAVRIHVTGYEPFARDVVLEAGRASELEIRLVRGAPLGQLEVIVESASGHWKGAVTVRAQPRREAPRWIEREVDIEGSARVVLDGIEARKHGVQVRAKDGTWILPENREVEAGDPPPRFLVRDDIPLETVAFQLNDASGAGIVDARVDVDVDSVPGMPEMALKRVLRGAAPTLRVPRGARLVWMAWREGLQPVFGETTVEPGRNVVVPMIAGWGADIGTFDTHGQPVPGVELALDGESIGRTDAAGKLRVVRTSAPRTLAVLDALWQLAKGGDVLPETGALRNQWPPTRVVLTAR